MQTPSEVNNLEYVDNCMGISIKKWESYMLNTTKANGKKIKSLIKKHLPDLYESIGLEFPNPFEHKSVKKDGLLVYVHSGIEYFFKYN